MCDVQAIPESGGISAIRATELTAEMEYAAAMEDFLSWRTALASVDTTMRQQRQLCSLQDANREACGICYVADTDGCAPDMLRAAHRPHFRRRFMALARWSRAAIRLDRLRRQQPI